MQIPTPFELIDLHSSGYKDPPSRVCREAARARRADVAPTLSPTARSPTISDSYVTG